MQREIKFRAWDGNKMHLVSAVYPMMRPNQGIACRVYDNITDQLIYAEALMQWTGLKDKHGVEIYEGDVVKSHTEKDMVVGWSDRFASFVIKRDGWMFQHWFGEALEGNECEVIGNIYSNPELTQK